jgi:hypothetical protein
LEIFYRKISKQIESIISIEEYYSRAILADPTDGEMMVQYAKLVWHQHADIERSLSYFEKAVQISPEIDTTHQSVRVLVLIMPAKLILIKF